MAPELLIFGQNSSVRTSDKEQYSQWLCLSAHQRPHRANWCDGQLLLRSDTGTKAFTRQGEVALLRRRCVEAIDLRIITLEQS